MSSVRRILPHDALYWDAQDSATLAPSALYALYSTAADTVVAVLLRR